MPRLSRTRVLRWALAIAIGAAFAAAAAFLAASLQENRYSAQSTLLFRGRTFVEAIPGNPVRGPSQSTTPSPAAVEAVLSLPVIAERTAKSLAGELSAAQVSDRVDLQMHPGSHLVTVDATAPGAREAAALANAYAEQAVALVRSVNRRIVEKAIAGQEDAELDEIGSPGRREQAERILARLGGRLRTLSALQVGALERVERATPPAEPSSPEPGTEVLLALLVGICGGAAVAALLDRREQLRGLRVPSPRMGG